MHDALHAGPRASGWETGELSFDFIILLLGPGSCAVRHFKEDKTTRCSEMSRVVNHVWGLEGLR